ncbi:HLA class II histocompatibility antigen, DR alpha chain-like [Tiliqua scincoides]|uniref:HLA class II histocompatibility antigen, DR alpha chain-like n=1 Tax=Tiliqua scincoides TaxID=71010 RepID=UPI003461A95E
MAPGTAAGRRGFPGRPWLALLLLALRALAEPGPGEDVLSQVSFVQRTLSSAQGPGEFLFAFDGDEIFHVDLQRREGVWRLPEFQEFTGSQAGGARGSLATLRSNLGVLMRRSNYTPAQNVPPRATVFPERPVARGEPNVLVCLVDGFSPPVLNVSWLRNGREVEAEGRVARTDFYPRADHSFRTFSYLAFLPAPDDTYFCRVEHWGLQRPLDTEWNANMPEPLPETVENVVCGLGLAVGIAGIMVGTVLAVRSRRQNAARHRQGPL